MPGVPEGFEGTEEELAAGRLNFSSDLAEAMSFHEKADLPVEEQIVLAKKQKATSKFFELNKKITATYKIEVQFGRGRSKHKPFPGSLHIYRSGSVLAGGGDEILYQCPDNTCPGIILPEHTGGAIAVCPACKRQFNRDKELHDTRLMNLPYEKWAEVIQAMFMRLGGDADVYLKTHGQDIRDASLKEQARTRMGEEYLKARTRVAVMYPLENILKDTEGNKSDLLSRFRALVVA